MSESRETIEQMMERHYQEVFVESARSTRYLLALSEAEAFARRIYEHIQQGAGCCAPAIGRGGRVLQVAEEIAQLRKKAEEWKPARRKSR